MDEDKHSADISGFIDLANDIRKHWPQLTAYLSASLAMSILASCGSTCFDPSKKVAYSIHLSNLMAIDYGTLISSLPLDMLRSEDIFMNEFEEKSSAILSKQPKEVVDLYDRDCSIMGSLYVSVNSDLFKE